MKSTSSSLLPGDRVQRRVWRRDTSDLGTVIDVCRIQNWKNTVRVLVHWDGCKHPTVTGNHLLTRVNVSFNDVELNMLKRVNMSLTDLELKKHTEPLSKEIDRQKEKAAYWKELALEWKKKAIEYASFISTKRKEIGLLANYSGDTTAQSLLKISEEMRVMSKMDVVEVGTLIRGDIVTALKDLDPSGANVQKGTKGVVFQPANFHDNNSGPMVRWFSGGACNIYDGDVIREEYKKKATT